MPASPPLGKPSRSFDDNSVRLPPTADATGGAGRGKSATSTAAPQQYTLRIPTRASSPAGNNNGDQPTLKKFSPVLGISVSSAQPAKRPAPPGSTKGASQFFVDPDAEFPARGHAGAQSSPSSSAYRSARRPDRLALPQSPLPKAFPRTLESSAGRDLFYEHAKSPMHSDSSPIVISSLCYSGATQAQTAMAAAARSEDPAAAAAGRTPTTSVAAAVINAHAHSAAAGETSVQALFKAYHNKQSDSAIHRQTVIAQAKARSARRQQRALQQTAAGSIAAGGAGVALPWPRG